MSVERRLVLGPISGCDGPQKDIGALAGLPWRSGPRPYAFVESGNCLEYLAAKEYEPFDIRVPYIKPAHRPRRPMEPAVDFASGFISWTTREDVAPPLRKEFHRPIEELRRIPAVVIGKKN